MCNASWRSAWGSLVSLADPDSRLSLSSSLHRFGGSCVRSTGPEKALGLVDEIVELLRLSRPRVHSDLDRVSVAQRGVRLDGEREDGPFCVVERVEMSAESLALRVWRVAELNVPALPRKLGERSSRRARSAAPPRAPRLRHALP